MHAVRLGYQGIELLETGRLTLPMAEPARSRVMAVRLGERSFEEVLKAAGARPIKKGTSSRRIASA